MVGGREIQSAIDAKTARRQTHRAFGRNMDAIRIEVFQCRCHLRIRLVGQADVRIGRAGIAAHVFGCHHQYRMAIGAQLLACSLQGIDHTIDLRRPGVGYDGDTHNSSAFSCFAA
ncbi:hypothetical protein D3C81_1849450 [compost metagenome]